MAIVGGYIGGGVSMVPAGSSQVILQWYTNDGANLKCTFSLVSSSKTYNIASDDHGYAEAIVDSGEYTISVSHSGQYEGDNPIVRTLNSTESYSVIFWGLAYASGIQISNNLNFNTQYSISNSENVVVASGVVNSSSTSIGLPAGHYTVVLTLYGHELQYPVDVISGETASVDLSGQFCKVTVTASTPGTIYLKYNTFEIRADTSIYIFKNNNQQVFGFRDDANYSGVVSDSIVTMNDISATPNGDTLSLKPTPVGRIMILTSSGSLGVKKSRYNIIAVGGGGGSVRTTGDDTIGIGGGGGGDIQFGDYVLSESEYLIEIGAGGISTASGYTESGTTTFGDIVSATGGASGGSNGGAGGSGGGGGGYCKRDGFGRSGGSATFGGGGGAGGSFYGNNSNINTPGGTYGGAGGKTILGQSGGDGQVPSAGSLFEGTESTGGSYVDSTDNAGGGGGGGGYGAKGGNGGRCGTNGGGGGGGGGGAAGGKGGDGGKGYEYSGTYGGYGGLGYGAGGGGATTNYNGDSNRGGGGGGGGGGYGTIKLAGDGPVVPKSNSYVAGASGAKGCIVIQWRSVT